uniref:Uncharacterized protein n=1 Tax=Populus trichocarpa TaxID=3694 RepID=A0A3N7FX20_POPTR
MRLLCFMERREGNGRKEKRCLHQGKQIRIFAFPHKSVVQGKAILEQFIYGDFLNGAHERSFCLKSIPVRVESVIYQNSFFKDL